MTVNTNQTIMNSPWALFSSSCVAYAAIIPDEGLVISYRWKANVALPSFPGIILLKHSPTYQNSNPIVIQYPPYEHDTVMPNVFPTANSHTPATNCASPPTKNAMPVMILGVVTPRVCALIREMSRVEEAKETRPRGEGFAKAGRAVVS